VITAGKLYITHNHRKRQNDNTITMIDAKIISQILQAKTLYEDDEEEDACRVGLNFRDLKYLKTQEELLLLLLLFAHAFSYISHCLVHNNNPFSLLQRLVESLTPEQAEAAANTSYAYWLHHRQETPCDDDEQPESSNSDDDGNDDSNTIKNENEHDDLRIKFAMKEARRHYVGEKKNFDKALEALIETMDFRIEKRIDLLRLIGDSDCSDDSAAAAAVSSSSSSGDEEERGILKRYRGYVEEELERQLTVVGGYDRHSRAVICRWGRNTPNYDADGFLMTLIYTCERAIAATEIRSRGQEERVISLLDLAQYDARNSPPHSLFRSMGYALQRYYPERNDAVVMFDPPFWLRAVYGIISAFLDPVTRKKVFVISGATAKETTLKEKIDTENALPVLLNDGSLSFGIDVRQYMYEVPFHGVDGLNDL
jgi:CRAL/TRIO domain